MRLIFRAVLAEISVYSHTGRPRLGVPLSQLTHASFPSPGSPAGGSLRSWGGRACPRNGLFGVRFPEAGVGEAEAAGRPQAPSLPAGVSRRPLCRVRARTAAALPGSLCPGTCHAASCETRCTVLSWNGQLKRHVYFKQSNLIESKARGGWP